MASRYCINTLSLAPRSLAERADFVARLGPVSIGPQISEIEAVGVGSAARLFRDAGVPVTFVTHMAFGYDTPEASRREVDRLLRTIDAVATLGGAAICMTTGGRGGYLWPQAADRFAEAIQPCAEYAKAASVRIGLEPTSHLYADVSIVHRLRDVVTLATLADIHVCLDIFPIWSDSDLDAAITAAGSRIALVQMSDHVAGDRGLPCRAVLGDGMAPVDHIVSRIAATGYSGAYDFEIIGPRLGNEGYEAGLRRCMARMDAALAKAG